MQNIQPIIQFCLSTANLSKCTDVGTAAVLCSKDLRQIYSIGVNGGPIDGQQCLCHDPFKAENNVKGKLKYTCVHAEVNCLVKNKTIDNIPKIMICSKQPCQGCAAAIINAQTNIEEVWFKDLYRDNTGVLLLLNAGIAMKQIHCFDGEYTLRNVSG